MILGGFVALDVVVGTLSMGAPLIANCWQRDAPLFAMLCSPLLQIGLFIIAVSKEEARPRLAIALYSAVLSAFAFQVAIPALIHGPIWCR
jgi:alpha-beta hydrolase superfamily lysophospholipase